MGEIELKGRHLTEPGGRRAVKDIAVISSNLLNSFAAQLLWGIQDASLDMSYDLEIYFAKSASKKGGVEYFYDKLINEKKACAVIILAYPLTERHISGMRGAGIVPVLIDSRASGIHSVNTDNEKGAYDAVKHLLDSGKKKIGIVVAGEYCHAQLQVESQRERLKGYRRALGEKNIPFDESLIWYIRQFNYISGKEAFRFMVSSGVDSVFCAAGDYVAAGILSEARMNRIDMPENMSLVGFDDIEMAKDLGLTTVRQPLNEMGAEAFKLAVEAVESRGIKPQVRLFQNTLIVRDTA